MFRDAIIGVNKNWDKKFYKKTCNKAVLRNMKYCPTENDIGVEFDIKTGKYYKACKLSKDNDKSMCLIF